MRSLAMPLKTYVYEEVVGGFFNDFTQEFVKADEAVARVGEMEAEVERLRNIKQVARRFATSAVHSEECCAHRIPSECICGLTQLEEAISALENHTTEIT